MKVGSETATILPLVVVDANHPNVYKCELPATNYTQIRFLRLPSSDPVAGEDTWGWNCVGYMPFNYSQGNYWTMNAVEWHGPNAGEAGDLSSFSISTFDPGAVIEDIIIRVKPVGGNTWPAVYLYTWGPENFGGWPGQQGVAEEGGWFKFTVAGTETFGHPIFSDGVGNNDGGEQFDADNVTLTTACYEISLTAATSVECSPSAITDKIQTSFLVYPNPVSTELFVESGVKNQESRFEIYDISGKLQLVTTLSQPYPNLVTTINVADLPAGTYFLKIDNQIVKFVKK